MMKRSTFALFQLLTPTTHWVTRIILTYPQRLHDPTKKSSSALAYLGKLVLDRSGDVYTSTQVDELGEDW